MSRVGKKPVVIPSGVTVTASGGKVSVKGKLGELALDAPASVQVSVAGSEVSLVDKGGETAESKAIHGLIRSLIANMIIGVAQGCKKELEIQGVGFKASAQGQKVVLSLGYSSPIEYDVPAGVKVAVEQNVNLTVTGCDKQTVGDVAARIKSFFPAEPYKGKGIRYKGEHIRRKVGKTVA